MTGSRNDGRKTAPQRRRETPWLVRHRPLYGGKLLSGLTELADASMLSISTVRYHYERMVPGIDMKPLLDRIAAGRKARTANPAIGPDGRSESMIFEGITFLSKKALAQHVGQKSQLQAKFGLHWGAVRDLLLLIPAGTDVTRKVNEWLAGQRRRAKINDFHEKYGFKKSILSAELDKGHDLDCAAKRLLNPLEPAESAERRRNDNWSRDRMWDSSRPKDRIQDKFWEWPKAVEKLANLDLTHAEVHQPKGGGDVRVRGLRCGRCDLPIPSEPTIAQLRKGQQPCPQCKRRPQSGSWSVRTIDSLRDIIRERKLRFDASAATLVRAGDMGRRGSSQYVVGLMCTRCGTALKGTAWESVMKGAVPCPECKRRERFSLAEQRVAGAHKGAIAILAYGGKLSAKSTFRCTRPWCGHTWRSTGNLVIGQGGGQKPTQCAMCRQSGTAEATIAHLLGRRGVEHKHRYPVREILAERGIEDSVTLFADFYLPRLGIVIEYDGEQHYDAFSHYARKEGLKTIRARDDVKVAALAKAGVPVHRIPFWSDIATELESILADRATYPGAPVDAELQRKRLGIDVRPRRRRAQ